MLPTANYYVTYRQDVAPSGAVDRSTLGLAPTARSTIARSVPCGQHSLLGWKNIAHSQNRASTRHWVLAGFEGQWPILKTIVVEITILPPRVLNFVMTLR
jgi:hypothetical protein